jgi:P27 family predicted phage terminase small subunit
MSLVRAPRDLDQVGRAAWKEAAAILAEISEDVDVNAPALRAYAHAESVAASIRGQWWADPRAVLTGGRGAKVANPVLRELERAEKRAAELRDALGLTPTSRRKLGRALLGGRPTGSASAPDRAQPPSRRRANVVALMPAAVREALGDR